jgi:hypothetical protein
LGSRGAFIPLLLSHCCAPTPDARIKRSRACFTVSPRKFRCEPTARGRANSRQALARVFRSLATKIPLRTNGLRHIGRPHQALVRVSHGLATKISARTKGSPPGERAARGLR